MTATKQFKTTWYPDEKLIITHISGDVTREEVEQWDQSLQQALGELPDNSTFKLFVNLNGFKAINFDAHKRFRTVIPGTLANYGWRVGYIDLFEEAANLPITQTRGITCTAAVHVHQDETKIALYDERFGRECERFFTDPQMAEEWIRSISG